MYSSSVPCFVYMYLYVMSICSSALFIRRWTPRVFPTFTLGFTRHMYVCLTVQCYSYGRKIFLTRCLRLFYVSCLGDAAGLPTVTGTTFPSLGVGDDALHNQQLHRPCPPVPTHVYCPAPVCPCPRVPRLAPVCPACSCLTLPSLSLTSFSLPKQWSLLLS